MLPSEDLTGRVLDGKYEVLRLLGRGGMGEVYAGTHLQLERPVAIKVLHGDLSDKDSFVARFAREARTAARLEHPNAVHVYDFGTLDNGSAYLVMEFIEGATLREVIRRHGRLSLPSVLDLMRQAAGAVGAAHARGIVHRDLKPENMMVRLDDAGRVALKVVDFGLAKMLENQTSQLTNRSELIGTPKYMAPEQFSGDRIDERVDIYALGCILFELLAGRAPHEGTMMEIVGKHVYAEVPSLESLGVEVAPDVEAVVRRALAKDPAARIQTAADLVRELESACGPEVVALAAEPITIPLPAPPESSGVPTPSEMVTRPQPGTQRTPSERTGEDLATRYAGPDAEATRARPERRPTLAIPEGNATAAPVTRAMTAPRGTAGDLENTEVEAAVARPARRSRGVFAVGAALLLGLGATGLWLAPRADEAPAADTTPQPAAAPALSAPAEALTPAAPVEPAPPPAPAPAPQTEPAAAEKPAATAKSSKKTKPAKAAAGASVEGPEDIEIPEINLGEQPEGMTREQWIELKRELRKLEIERRRRIWERRNRVNPPPPPPQKQ